MSQITENTILATLTGHKTAGKDAVNELVAITGKYPAFGVAKYLLAKKTFAQQQGSEKYAQDAVLYFADPFWFHFKLNEELLIGTENIQPKKEAPKTIPQAVLEEVTTGEPVVLAMEERKASAMYVEGEVPVNTLTESRPLVKEEQHQQQHETSTGQTAGTALPAVQDVLEQQGISAEKAGADAIEIQPLSQAYPALAAEKTSTPAEAGRSQIKFTLDVSEPDEDGEDNENTDGAQADDVSTRQTERISAVLQEHLADFKKPVAENTPVPVETEPYHTIDYFASQGIKLTLEQQAQDHLSVKVKKFTDWLKQMKRIAPQPSDLGVDEAAEHRVKNIAAGSNEVKEVLTETMAEVLVKQGMKEKAAEVYSKLSLLYPAKSAYFAAQIEQLKEN